MPKLQTVRQKYLSTRVWPISFKPWPGFSPKLNPETGQTCPIQRQNSFLDLERDRKGWFEGFLVDLLYWFKLQRDFEKIITIHRFPHLHSSFMLGRAWGGAGPTSTTQCNTSILIILFIWGGNPPSFLVCCLKIDCMCCITPNGTEMEFILHVNWDEFCEMIRPYIYVSYD